MEENQAQQEQAKQQPPPPPPQPAPPPQAQQQPMFPPQAPMQHHAGFIGFDPNWNMHAQQMHAQAAPGYHLPPGAMDGSLLPAGIPGLTDSMDPLEAVLGPFPCARLRGLPFDASLEDVLVFFQGLVVLDVVVVSSGNSDGKGTGEAFVVFANPMDFQMALQRDRHNMGHRYIEVFQGKRSDYYAAIASQYWQNKENQGEEHEDHVAVAGVEDAKPGPAWGVGGGVPVPGQTLKGGPAPQAHGPPPGTAGAILSGNGVIGEMRKGHGPGQVPMGGRGGGGHMGVGIRGVDQGVPGHMGGKGAGASGRGGGIRDGEHTGYLRMRGLPFSASKEDVLEFFKGYKPVDGSICLTVRSDGRATGEGYVAFSSPEDSKKAMDLHRNTMGSRYIELFISNKEEHSRALSRTNGR